MGGLLTKSTSKPKSTSKARAYQELPDAPGPPPYNPPSASAGEKLYAANLIEEMDLQSDQRSVGEQAYLRNIFLPQAVQVLKRVGYPFMPGTETTQVLAGLGWLKAECAQATDVQCRIKRGRMNALLARYEEALAKDNGPEIRAIVGAAYAITSIPRVDNEGKHLYLEHWHVMQVIRDMVDLNACTRGACNVIAVDTCERIRVVLPKDEDCGPPC